MVIYAEERLNLLFVNITSNTAKIIKSLGLSLPKSMSFTILNTLLGERSALDGPDLADGTKRVPSAEEDGNYVEREMSTGYSTSESLGRSTVLILERENVEKLITVGGAESSGHGVLGEVSDGSGES